MFLFAAALAGCDSPSTVTVTPSTATAIEDNFFVTWEIQSLRLGAFDCAQAGAATVDMDLVNADSGERFIYRFPCSDFAATSGPVTMGHFDVLLTLLDGGDRVLSSVDIGTQNLTRAGTLDLGHIVFQLP
jgi:hypothetical protein